MNFIDFILEICGAIFLYENLVLPVFKGIVLGLKYIWYAINDHPHDSKTDD